MREIYDGSRYAFVKLSLANKGLLGIYEVYGNTYLRDI